MKYIGNYLDEPLEFLQLILTAVIDNRVSEVTGSIEFMRHKMLEVYMEAKLDQPLGRTRPLGGSQMNFNKLADSLVPKNFKSEWFEIK